jgi:uncharacterized protein YdiU (UPF0061 family)
MARKVRKIARPPDYPQFQKINGDHPHKDAIPEGHVPYPARRLRGSEVVYFNYGLAREMGLIPARHPDRMNQRLRQAILDTFSLRIINEYDRERGTSFAERDILPNTFMATRYLAMQHPGRTGKTSGDGRSIWNGTLTHRGTTWDISSCGTGVTRLCPATAETNQYYRTGNCVANYGCGTATVQEGLIAALMSEIFHRNGIATERVLAVVELADGFAVNVRAGRNLLRPSHFFVHLKQNRTDAVRASIDCFIDRQMRNGFFPKVRSRNEHYRMFAEEMARTFARITATFEREYIFCWLDWDGDNILADGGIIDYGSVRQFGLYHREYRFDDGPRWSTTIPEQKRKARYIVQSFAQIRDLLIDGKKPRLKALSDDPVLETFDREFDLTKDRLLLRDVGFDAAARDLLLARARPTLHAFAAAHAYFEHARAARGPRKVPDGISWNAIFSTRDLLRELPGRYLEHGAALSTREFLDIGLSDYASMRDRRVTSHRKRRVAQFQRTYTDLIEAAARVTKRSVPLLLGDIAARSAILNRYDRITGDGIVHAATRLLRNRRRLGCDGIHEVVAGFASYQTRLPEQKPPQAELESSDPDSGRVLDVIIDLVAHCRHSL